MHTFFLSGSSFPPVCGDGARLFHLVTRFREPCEVFVINSRFNEKRNFEEKIYGNVKLKNLNTGFKDLFKVNEALKKLKQGDRLVIYGLYPHLLFLIHTIIKIKNKGIKLVVDVEDSPTYSSNYPFLNFYIRDVYKKILNFADRIICVSHHLKEELKSSFKISSAKMKVIPNGVNTSHFKMDEASRKILRRQHNIDDEDMVFIYSGSITEERWEKRTLNNFKLAIDANPKVKLFILGNFNPPEYEKVINNTLEALKLEDHVKYLGYFEFEKVPDILSIGDVGILPFKKNSKNDAASNIKIFEYMSMGLPVISTNLRGSREIIKNFYNGIIVTNDDEFLSSIIKISEDRDLYKKLSKNALKTAKNYDWKIIAKNFKNILDTNL